MNTDASSYTPADKLDNRILRNFLSATAMLGHLCALYDRGVFEAGRLMSNPLFQLAVKRKRNTPLLEQAGALDAFQIIVDQRTLGSKLASTATMSSLVESLAPDSEPTGIPFTSVNNIVNQQLLDFIKDATATERIYIFGRVYYEDIAGEERETEFSLVNEPGCYELRFHHKHNRMR